MKDDAVITTEVQVLAGAMESLFDVIGPEQSVINTPDFVFKLGGDFVVSLRKAILRSKETLWRGEVPVSSKWCDECGLVAVFFLDCNRVKSIPTITNRFFSVMRN